MYMVHLPTFTTKNQLIVGKYIIEWMAWGKKSLKKALFPGSWQAPWSTLPRCLGLPQPPGSSVQTSKRRGSVWHGPMWKTGETRGEEYLSLWADDGWKTMGFVALEYNISSCVYRYICFFLTEAVLIQLYPTSFVEMTSLGSYDWDKLAGWVVSEYIMYHSRFVRIGGGSVWMCFSM